MKFLTDVGELAVVPGRDREPAEVDLTRNGLGDRSFAAHGPSATTSRSVLCHHIPISPM